MEINRRDAMKTIATSLGSVAALTTISAFSAEREKSMLESIILNLEELKPKALAFDAKKLRGISEKLIISHWENNYSGSVKILNDVNKKLSAALADKDFPPYAYNGLKREHLMRTGSVVFHELYFGNLGGSDKPTGEIEKAIKASFSDFNTWETEFRRMAQGLGGGSGWVVLGYNYHLKRLENYWAADHMHSAAGSIPLLVMDMYEHSYQMDYGAAAAKYIEAFFQNIQWEEVNRRLELVAKNIQ